MELPSQNPRPQLCPATASPADAATQPSHFPKEFACAKRRHDSPSRVCRSRSPLIVVAARTAMHSRSRQATAAPMPRDHTRRNCPRLDPHHGRQELPITNTAMTARPNQRKLRPLSATTSSKSWPAADAVGFLSACRVSTPDLARKPALEDGAKSSRCPGHAQHGSRLWNRQFAKPRNNDFPIGEPLIASPARSSRSVNGLPRQPANAPPTGRRPIPESPDTGAGPTNNLDT